MVLFFFSLFDFYEYIAISFGTSIGIIFHYQFFFIEEVKVAFWIILSVPLSFAFRLIKNKIHRHIISTFLGISLQIIIYGYGNNPYLLMFFR